VRYTDPSGHYGKEVHLYLTRQLSLEVASEISQALSVNKIETLILKFQAMQIAKSDQKVDSSLMTFSLNIIPLIKRLKGMSPSEYYHFQSRREAEKRLRKAISNGDIKAFGQALHTFQDYFSHTGSGFSFPSGQQAGGDALRSNCPECFTGDAWADNPIQTSQLLGHLAGPNWYALKSQSSNPYSSTDEFDLRNPRDVTMYLATKYWITMWYLSRYNVDPNWYYLEKYGISAEEYYDQLFRQ